VNPLRLMGQLVGQLMDACIDALWPPFDEKSAQRAALAYNATRPAEPPLNNSEIVGVRQLIEERFGPHSTYHNPK
jgi:hypothetical protein